MPEFSKGSDTKLCGCDQRLQDLFRAVVKKYNCTIIEGNRTRARQKHMFDTGKSKLNWPDSRHNTVPSLAVDVAPYIPGRGVVWEKRQCTHFAGYVQATADHMGIPLRWGGDWDSDRDVNDQTFNDLVHFEIKKELP